MFTDILEWIWIGMLLKIAGKDWKLKKIENRDVKWVGVCACSKMLLDGTRMLPEHLGGGFLGFFIFFIIAMIVPNAFGGGDVKLSIVNGFFLGTQAFLNSFLFAIGFAALFLVMWLFRRRISWKEEVAFGPFLCAGAVFAHFIS